MLSGLAQTLTVLGTEANTQTGHLRSLAEESKGEARSMSVLTLIATIYIPASLLAVSSDYRTFLWLHANFWGVVDFLFGTRSVPGPCEYEGH